MTIRRTTAARRSLIAGAAVAVAGLVASACGPPPATTTRVSVDPDGAQLQGDSRKASISADGRFVAFTTTARLNGGAEEADDVFVKERDGGAMD